MAIVGLRQDLQVQPSFDTSQNAAPGPQLVTGSTSLESDLIGLRSQLARWFDATGATNWYDDVYANGSTQKMGIKQLADGLYSTQQQLFAIPTGVYASVAVPAGKNYVILSVANNETPSGPLAIGLNTKGAIVAKSTLNGAAFAANELTSVAGQDSLSPLNKLLIRNNANGNPVEDSAATDIYGLLQVESTTADGATANDSSGGSRVKISFVKVNYSTKMLVAADVADVAGVTINYVYKQNIPYAQLPRGAIGGSGGFVDNIGVADVTVTRAVANQAGTPVPVPQPLVFQVPNASTFKVQSANGGTDFVSVVPTSSGTTVAVNANQFTAATTSASTFTQGANFATATQTVNVGTTLGQVDSAGLTIASTGSNPLKLVSTAQITFKDAYIGQSSFSAPQLALASGASDYNNYKAAFGEVSIAQALYTASRSANHQLVFAQVTAVTVAANTNLTGAGANANISAQFPDYSAISNVASQVKVMFNGVLLEPGSTKGWYPGTNKATGDIMLTFGVRAPVAGAADRLQMEIFGSM